MTDVYKRVGAMLLLQWMNRPERQPLTQGLETSFATDAAFEALREQVDQQSNGRLRLFRLKDSETALFFPERPAGTSGVVLRDDGDTEAYLPQFQQQGKMFILLAQTELPIYAVATRPDPDAVVALLESLVIGKTFKVEGEQLHVMERIGRGGQSVVFSGRYRNLQVACKVTPIIQGASSMQMEFYLARGLEGVVPVPVAYALYTDQLFQIGVFQRLDRTLAQLLRGGRFSEGTCAWIARTLIGHMKNLHARGDIYIDVKPDNYMIGYGCDADKIYWVDIGTLVPAGRTHPLDVGTPYFTSIAAHRGHVLGPKQDLEALGYILALFATGTLPWDSMASSSQLAEAKQRALPQTLAPDFVPLQLYFERIRTPDYVPNYIELAALFPDNVVPEWFTRQHRRACNIQANMGIGNGLAAIQPPGEMVLPLDFVWPRLVEGIVKCTRERHGINECLTEAPFEPPTAFVHRIRCLWRPPIPLSKVPRQKALEEFRTDESRDVVAQRAYEEQLLDEDRQLPYEETDRTALAMEVAISTVQAFLKEGVRGVLESGCSVTNRHISLNVNTALYWQDEESRYQIDYDKISEAHALTQSGLEKLLSPEFNGQFLMSLLQSLLIRLGSSWRVVRTTADAERIRALPASVMSNLQPRFRTGEMLFDYSIAHADTRERIYVTTATLNGRAERLHPDSFPDVARGVRFAPGRPTGIDIPINGFLWFLPSIAVLGSRSEVRWTRTEEAGAIDVADTNEDNKLTANFRDERRRPRFVAATQEK